MFYRWHARFGGIWTSQHSVDTSQFHVNVPWFREQPGPMI
jgi:hypothetical protein